MKKVIVSISELSKTNWITIYKFIDGFYTNTLSENTFNQLRDKAVITKASVALDKDAYSSYGDKLTFETLPSTDEATFSLIYIKPDDKEDFSDLVPFFLLEQKFAEKITLGIDVEKISIDKNKQGTYIFKCSDFLRFIVDKKPLLGRKSIYFINVKTIDRNTGEIKFYSTDRVTSLIGKGKSASEDNLANDKPTGNSSFKASRRYLPLLKINETNFKEFFGQKKSTTEETKYIEESVKKISIDLIKKKFPINNEKYNSIFEEWFIKSYFFSLEKSFNKIGYNKYKSLQNVLHIYYQNIYELVQNIIFHAGKTGFMYFVFNRKENISEIQKTNIPELESYNDADRFIEIGIFDFNEQGIIEHFTQKYGSESKFELEDFFDPKSILTTGLTHLEFRYTAHLGIKSFVKSVLNNKGYFSVESSYRGKKQRIESFLVDKNEFSVQPLGNEIFVDGTHYQIILPVQSLNNYLIPLNQTQTQKKSFKDKLHERIIYNNLSIKHIRLLDIISKSEIELAVLNSKNEQIKYIEFIGNEILKGIKVGHEIAIDLSNINIDAKFLFKLLSYIQLTHKTTFEKIILTYISNDKIEEFCNTIKQFLIYPKVEPIWSQDSALILVSDTLHYQIICGETEDDLFYLNNELKKYYYPQKNYFDVTDISPKRTDKLNKFLLPYEILIEKDKCSYFEQYVLGILKKDIEAKDMGYLVKHEYTYIGSKLIIRNFYEADSMFQNSFFSERLAYLIAREIQQSEYLTAITRNGKSAILIGYKSYSEFLVKAIRYMVKIPIETVIIANEEKEGEGIIFNFDKSVDDQGEVIENKIIDNPNNYKIITIVPIGSTLTTSDKIIAFFKLHIDKFSDSSGDLDFVYNHCSIVVRDKVEDKPTNMEIKQKWENINDTNIVKTSFENAKDIHFSIQIGAKDGESNWIQRLNDQVSFPVDWRNEQYINFTENSSINSQNLMGYPKVNKSASQDINYDHNTELDRLYELKENIYSGHIECHKSHYRYYFDTETFIKRKNKPEFNKWMSIVSNSNVFRKDIVNVLITPNAKLESDFVNTINEQVFDGNALIIYLDINNWRNNIIHKLSYLRQLIETKNKDKNLPIIEFHYTDHALLTSETYKRVKSYMYSLLDNTDNFHFTSIITLINRLSYDRDKEIRRDVESKLFAFVNFFIPPSKDPERDCILCGLFRYYDKIKRNTVLETCSSEISENLNKIKIRIFSKDSEKTDELFEKEKYSENTPELVDERKFIRLLLTHKILYIVSNISKEVAPDNQDEEIKQKLDNLYDGSEKTRLDTWRENESLPKSCKCQEIKQYIDEKFTINKEISFLKVISSPPLSQYIRMRKYAHQKLLAELANILPKKDDNGDFIFDIQKRYKYDDIRKLKAILKSLSFLKSNALVRNEVITGAWAICFKVMDGLNEEIEYLNDLLNKLNYTISDSEQFYSSSIKSKKELFNEQITISYELDNKKLDHIITDIQKDLNTLNRGKKALIKNFKSEFQFFVKNSIFEDEAKSMYLGELLRTGEEVSLLGQTKNFKISQTIQNNKLFKEFEQPAYKEFLVWLFYDNTTIIRKTLQNFEKELEKDKKLNDYFYSSNKLRSFYDIKTNMDKIIDDLKKKIQKEYYYSNFNHYLENGDDIDFIEKFIFTLYAQEKLKELNSENGKKDIESDIEVLLEIFKAIMEADAAFFTMKKETKSEEPGKAEVGAYILSHHGLSDKNISYIIDNNHNYYTTNIIKQVKEKYKYFPYPIISNPYIEESIEEKKLGNFNKLNLLLIEKPNTKDLKKSHEESIIDKYAEVESEKSFPLGAFTFLYNDNNDEDTFRKRSREHGRLLLLLNNDLNKYVIDYLLNEKVFDLWVEKHENIHKFEKIYGKNRHVFKSVSSEMDRFENLDDTYLSHLCLPWFVFTNQIVSFLYANIEKNDPNDLSVTNDTLIIPHTLGDIFNKTFTILTESLLSQKWNNSGKDHKVKIIKSDDLDNSAIYNDSTYIGINKHFIRTFIFQQLDNALNDDTGHCEKSETKIIHITITNSSVKVMEVEIQGSNPERRSKKKKEFEAKRENIKNMNCKRYSSTTLTSLQGVINFLNKKQSVLQYECDFNFNADNYFFIEITFKSKTNEPEQNFNF